ncbi:MAG: WecB/TagA/CpsF family glycosyltransferase [Pseudomonadota bacterium]
MTRAESFQAGDSAAPRPASNPQGFTLPGTSARITAPSWDALLSTVEARLAARAGFSLATLNLDHLVKLRKDAAFREAYAAHDLVTADGNPIVWLARLAGHPVELVPGADLIVPLAAAAARQGVSVALVGSTEDTLEAAATRLRTAAPALEIALLHAPARGFDPNGDAAKALIERIGESGAGLCLLALGAPKQERFAAMAQSKLPGIGFASLGAALDFAAGRQQRAPVLVRKLALEWVWRLATEPKRLAGRYLACVLLLPRLLAAALAYRLNHASGDATGKGAA